MAVKYLFLTNEGQSSTPKLVIEPFNALLEQNDYEVRSSFYLFYLFFVNLSIRLFFHEKIPWSLRDLIANPLTSHLFSTEIDKLREAFKGWHPKTAVLRELRKKVAPLGRVHSIGGGYVAGESNKL